MPLGDSITDGFNVPGGYRVNLWQRLATGGYTVDFVGSGFNGPTALGDHDHEGHSGWRIDQIDANIVGWLQTYTPRTILLHIGTNDMNQNYNIATAPARLSALIDKIRANAPAVELFVAQITPESDATLASRVQAFNAAIPGIVAGRDRLTHLVDMYSAITTADLADGVHPNATGYDKMAARWFTALQSVPGSLQAVTGPPVGVAVSLVNPQSNRCLDVSGVSTTPGARVHIWDCHGGTNQALGPYQRRRTAGLWRPLPGYQRQRHRQRYQGADLDLQRFHGPAVHLQRQRFDRRHRVGQVRRRRGQRHGQWHSRAGLVRCNGTGAQAVVHPLGRASTSARSPPSWDSGPTSWTDRSDAHSVRGPVITSAGPDPATVSAQSPARRTPPSTSRPLRRPRLRQPVGVTAAAEWKYVVVPVELRASDDATDLGDRRCRT